MGGPDRIHGTLKRVPSERVVDGIKLYRRLILFVEVLPHTVLRKSSDKSVEDPVTDYVFPISFYKLTYLFTFYSSLKVTFDDTRQTYKYREVLGLQLLISGSTTSILHPRKP